MATGLLWAWPSWWGRGGGGVRLQGAGQVESRGGTPGSRPHAAPSCPSAGIAVGFYGNGETSDGIHRATYSLRHANRTVAGVQDRVSGRMGRGDLFLLLHPCVCMCVRARRGRVRERAGAVLVPAHCLPQPGAGVGHGSCPEPHGGAQPAEPGAAAGRPAGAPAGGPAATGPAADAAGLHGGHPFLEEPSCVAGGTGRAGGSLRLVQVHSPLLPAPAGPHSSLQASWLPAPSA